MKVVHVMMLTVALNATSMECNSQTKVQYPSEVYRTIVSNESTIVPTVYGKIQGYLDGNIYTFKGVPYAKAERFMPPANPDKFEGVKVCRIYGPKAPQTSTTLNWQYRHNDYDFAFQFNLEPMDEKNCQVLNVWTQGINDGKKRPVFVWLHGGGFSSGSGNDLPCYEGRTLAQKGDIVVVTINHRLNILGYLDLRGLGGEYAESVNLGQQDIVKALEWVHTNIANFGGDPSNVTIGGQSGGGGKVSNTMAMPAAHGLFQKAIVQSGSNMPNGNSEATKAFGLAFAKQLHVTPANTERLNDFTYQELIEAYQKTVKETKGAGFGGQLPTIDGKYIVESPVAPEISKDIPLLLGTNLYEFNNGKAMPDMTVDKAKEQLNKRIGKDQTDSFIKKYSKFFPDMEPRDLLNTDFFFRAGAVKQANAKSAQGAAKVYMFLFTWKPQDSDLGPCHGMELPFMFNNISLQREMTRATEDAYQLADLISSAWIQFIKTGNPNTEGIPAWEPYTEENGAVMFFDNNCRMEYQYDKTMEEFATQGRPF